MKPLIFWHWNRLPSLREADNQIKSFAERGFGGAVILPEAEFLTERFFGALLGSCRSACRTRTELYICGGGSCFGSGEVASVPEFRAKALLSVPKASVAEGESVLAEKDGSAVVLRCAAAKGGFCPIDVFNPSAAEAYIESVLLRIKRRAPRFIGYELKGIYLQRETTPELWPKPSLPYSEALAAVIKERLGVTASEAASEIFFGSGSLRKKYEAVAAELCSKAFYAKIADWCKGEGLRLIGEAGCGMAEPVMVIRPENTGHRFFVSAFADLKKAAVDGAALIAADGDSVGFDGLSAEPFSALRPCVGGDLLWTSSADRLTELLRGGEAAKAPDSLTARRSERALFIANTGSDAVQTETDVSSYNVFDDLTGELYSPEKCVLGFTLLPGGSLTLLPRVESAPAPLPPFIRSGAVFGKPKKPKRLPLCLTEAGENSLCLGTGARHEFEVQCVGGELYAAAAGGGRVSLNGSELTQDGFFLAPELARFPITGLVRLGTNVLETDTDAPAFVVGDFSAGEGGIIPPPEAVCGDVCLCGMPNYAGALTYQVQLPDEIAPDSLLHLTGSFALAEVKIGRRRERAVTEPFLFPLYAADAGRVAEIKIFGTLCSLFANDNSHNSYPYGLDSAELV